MGAARRVISALLALGLLALSVIALVEVILGGLGQDPWLVDEQAVRAWLAARRWDDVAVIAAWSALLALGLGLLVLALKRGRARGVALNSDDEAASMSVRRRSLERYLAGVAGAQPGVRGARAKVRRGTVRVRADTATGDMPDIRERVHRAVSERVQGLDPVPPLTTSVSVRTREG